MDYLTKLQYITEPFLSPSEPEFYLSQANRDLIEKLSNNIFLSAGLQLLIGPDGLGKTTLLNQLALKFREDNKTVVLLIHNPHFRDLGHFLITAAGTFKTINAPAGFDDNIFQEAFNSFFYKLCKEEKKIVLLLLDNGQDLPDFCLQAINSFYDYHPDCKRYLQTIICGDPEFQKKISADNTINKYVYFVTTPKPFNFRDIRNLIRFHLKNTTTYHGYPTVLFSLPSQWIVYRMTQGHPQKTIDLLHLIILTLVIDNQKNSDWFMALRSAKLLFPKRAIKLQIVRTTSLSGLIVFMLVLGLWSKGFVTQEIYRQENQSKMAVEQKIQSQEAQSVTNNIETQEIIPQDQDKEEQPEVAKIKKTQQLVLPIEKQAPEVQTFVTPAIGDEQVAKQPDQTRVSESQLNMVSVQEHQQEDSQGPLRNGVKPPENLGAIITAPGENLGDMIRRIYGPWSFNPENVKTVLGVNPNLKSPELLQVGQKILFPTIPVKLTPKANEVWWIRIATLNNIQSAYRLLRKHRKSTSPLLIIPSRDDSNQVLFNILLEEYFMDKESAQQTIQALSDVFKAQAEILDGLNPKTFYYRVKEIGQNNDNTL